MARDRVALRFGAAGHAQLRELNGHDERSVADVGTASAIRLLDRLLVEAPGAAVRPGEAETLPAADRDRLLAAVWRRAYGDRIASTVRCVGCGAPFDLDFSLGGLVASLDRSSEAAGVERLDDGTYRFPDGVRFRLPTGRDECEAAALGEAEAERALLERCRVEGEAPVDAAALRDALERAAPIVDLDLSARCPECGREQPVHFDIQSYLLGALLEERRQLVAEAHLLARTYGWSPSGILDWTRAERRSFVALIEADSTRAAGVLG